MVWAAFRNLSWLRPRRRAVSAEKGKICLIFDWAAKESREKITAALGGALLVLIVAGMGGGTGTGGAPVIAALAKQMGILTAGMVTRSFAFKDGRRMKLAEDGVKAFLASADSVIVLPNESVKQVDRRERPVPNAFQRPDELLRQGVQSLAASLGPDGFVSLAFEDAQKILAEAGVAGMALGTGKGGDKAQKAANAVLACPLLKAGAAGARGLIACITASPDTKLDEIKKFSSLSISFLTRRRTTFGCSHLMRRWIRRCRSRPL